MANHYSIFVGTVLGASEYVADALADTIKNNGDSVDIQLTPNLEQANMESTWIICTSTHGAGDLPDNIEPFHKQLQQADLSGINAFVVGLGDSSYDTFCFGAMTIENTIKQQGARLLATPLHIDVLQHPIPEDVAVEWLTDQIS